MFGLSNRTLGDAVILAALGVGAAWLGYLRRRQFWSRRSWVMFGLTLLAGVVAFAFSVSFFAVIGAPWTGAPGSNLRGFWVLIAMGGVVGGMGLVSSLLYWFVQGHPEKPFTLDRFRRAVRLFVRERPALRSFQPAPSQKTQRNAS